MLAYSIHYLLAYFDDLSGQRQTVVSLHELRNQRVAVLVSLLDCSLFVDFRGTVGRVDLAAHIDRQGYLPSDESETAVLQCQEPIRSHDRGEKLLNLGINSVGISPLPRMSWVMFPTGPFKSLKSNPMSLPK